MTNYFTVRVGKKPIHVFFNDSKVVDTQAAYTKAMFAAGGTSNVVSLYKLPPNSGPWDRLGLCGFRRRGEIISDIASTDDPNELELREQELDRLDREYFANGRDRIPLTEVAA